MTSVTFVISLERLLCCSGHVNAFNTKYKTSKQTNTEKKNVLNEFLVTIKHRMHCCIIDTSSMLFLLLLRHNMHPTQHSPSNQQEVNTCHMTCSADSWSELPNASDIPPQCETDPGHVISCHSEGSRTAARRLQLTLLNLATPCIS